MTNSLFSRNGYNVNAKRLNLTEEVFNEFIISLQKKHEHLFEELEADVILFDGELMPWDAMGKELIEKDFRLASKALEGEIAVLNENGFDTLFAALKVKTESFDDNSTEHQKNLKRTFEEVEKEIQPKEKMTDDLSYYNHQIVVFGEPGVLEYKPFSILKIIKENGTEENWVSSTKNNADIFPKISTSVYAVLDFEKDSGKIYLETDEIYENTFDETANKFWQLVTQKEMEGFVIKPQTVYIPNVAPYLKCRNKEYLRLVYGMDYQSLAHKTEKLLKGKSIRKKLETSIKEWELGRRMLDVPMEEISTNNGLWLTLSLQLMSTIDSENELDPRL